uniref:Retrovirus-related Gag polyprotein from transposon gypsy n=1 Tax=Bactrocera latifrons TaxID=174628 RepID=A0A0K8VV68_BACLA
MNQPEINALNEIIQDLQRRLAQREATQGTGAIHEYQNQLCTYNDPKEVDLNIFKTLPTFNGDYHDYRNWRKMACTLMQNISKFQGQNIYAEALIMVRSKITGRAAQILINNNTKQNFDAIVERLDDSYADQRPLYVLEEEMMKIRQENQSLHVYYDRLNQSLNIVLSKIEMTHKNEYVAQALSKEVQSKAVRTFITGLRSLTTKNALYSRGCRNITEAYGIARNMQHDSQYQQLEYIPRMNTTVPKYNPFNTYQLAQQRVEQMEIDPSSAQFRRHTRHNHQQPVQPANAQQQANQQGITQQQRSGINRQRINTFMKRARDSYSEHHGKKE